MADFRYGFFVRPNKKIESNPEEKSKTSHISDPKSKPARADTEGRRQQPTPILPRTRFVTTTEKYTEEVYSSDHKGKWNPSPALNHPIEFTKLIAKAQQEARQPKHEMRLSEPMNDIGKAIEYLKEAVNLHSAKNNACSASDHHHKDGCIKTIDSKEAARGYGKFEAPAPVSGANVARATIDCKEAARKYKGTTV